MNSSHVENSRDKLIGELQDKFYFPPNGSSPMEIADFIIIDRAKRKLEILEMWKRSNKSGAIYSFLRQEINQVNKVLKLAGVNNES